MICLQVHVTTSPLATQEQQLGVLVAGAGLRLDADSTLGCTSSIEHFSLLAAFTNSIREDEHYNNRFYFHNASVIYSQTRLKHEHYECLMLFVSAARSTLPNLYILD